MENIGQPTTDSTSADLTAADVTGATDVPSTPDVPTAPDSAADQDELAALDQLEADLAAVEQAITTLEQISTDGSLGDSAASQIATAVPQGRFASAATSDQI
ncbi:MAG: hypothetical protein F2942_01295 [Actinobacteria bacterium]|uniref:Unannotated protein n=1 Tax=freshwater metagenome TaxID=449393 RepID=A0A6J7U6Y2_9ZZZZ|nr:hypothetical protein [Actinomycetota bacterium]